MNVDRVQGLIDIGRIKSRDTALVMAEYLVQQGLLSPMDYEAVSLGIELPEPINLKELLEERDELLVERGVLESQVMHLMTHEVDTV